MSSGIAQIFTGGSQKSKADEQQARILSLQEEQLAEAREEREKQEQQRRARKRRQEGQLQGLGQLAFQGERGTMSSKLGSSNRS